MASLLPGAARPLTERSGRRAAPLLACACLLLAMAPAHAVRWFEALRETPFASLEEDDLSLFIDTARQALNELPDQQAVQWRNPETGNGGELRALQSTQSQGRHCRQMQVSVHAGRQEGSTRLWACKVDGRWRLVTASEMGH